MRTTNSQKKHKHTTQIHATKFTHKDTYAQNHIEKKINTHKNLHTHEQKKEKKLKHSQKKIKPKTQRQKKIYIYI